MLAHFFLRANKQEQGSRLGSSSNSSVHTQPHTHTLLLLKLQMRDERRGLKGKREREITDIRQNFAPQSLTQARQQLSVSR